jgi:hypothetical protein
MSLSTELRLNGLHVEEGTPKLDDVLIVSRGGGFKLPFRFALQHREIGSGSKELQETGKHLLRFVSKRS